MSSDDRQQQKANRYRVFRQPFFNAIGFSLIIHNVVYLLALHHGATDAQMSLLYAAIHITTFAAIFTPILFRGHDMCRLWSQLWWVRGAFCLGYLALPLIPGLTSAMAVWIVVVLHYCVALTRGLAMPVPAAVWNRLFPARELQTSMARVIEVNQWGVLTGFVLAFVCTHYVPVAAANKDLVFLLLIGIGMCANSFAAFDIGRFPRVGSLDHTSLQGMGRALREKVPGSRMRRGLITVSTLTMLNGVLLQYQISFFKNTLALADDTVFLLTILGIICAIGMATFMRITGSRITALSLLGTVSGGVLLLSVIYAFVPADIPFAVVAILHGLITLGMSCSGSPAAKSWSRW